MKAVINIKTDPKVKKAAQKIAKQMGLSLSGVLNAYLHKFVNKAENQKVILSNKAVSDLEEALEEYKQGNVHSFDTPEKALEFLDEIIEEKEQNED